MSIQTRGHLGRLALGVIGVSILSLVLFTPSAMAQTATSSGDGLTQIGSFLRSVVRALSGLAGLVATCFFVLGGLSYITSAGNPIALERAKRTLLFASFGLVITIAAFALSDAISNLATQAFGGN